jgi:hypothetical protein
MLGFDLEREIMRRIFPVFFGVTTFVATTAYIAAYETNPEIICAIADTAELVLAASEGWVVGVLRIGGGTVG